jgi:hypothetical protein
MKGIAMTGKGFKVYFLLFVLFFFIGCQSTNKEHLVYGRDCKLWLLFDSTITTSGKTPFVLCFNKKYYNCYSIKSDGLLRKRVNDDLVYRIIEGGKWEIQDKSIIINNVRLNIENMTEDTILTKAGVYLINVTHKYDIINCDSKNLVAKFKGGAVDSIADILNYNEQKR